MGIRRELATALRKVDELAIVAGQQDAELGKGIKIQIIKSGVFGAALRVVEYFDPSTKPNMPLSAAQTSSHLSHKPPPPAANPLLSHGLSRTAHNAVVKKKRMHPMAPLLAGPLAIVTFPAVSTAHLKAVLSILAPHAPAFPAPTRRANPSYYDLGVQAGLQKLLLLGARVEGQVFDLEGTRWVGGIEGGLDGLRGQLVALLQGVGAGVTGTLEAMSKTLYLTIDGRRSVLEEGEKEEQEKTDA
jgi:ribosomal protein L10